MLNKRIATGFMSIAGALAIAGGATFAFFTDTAVSANNVFRSGTLDLRVADNDQSFSQNVSASFVTPANWAPGQTHTDFICFNNAGSVPIQQILMDLNSDNAGSTTLDNFVYVSSIKLGDVTGNAEACGSNGATSNEALTEFKPLFDQRFGLNASVNSLLTEIDGTDQVKDDLLNRFEAVIPVDGVMKLRVTWMFDAAATSAEAGQSLDLDVNFKATQEEVDEEGPEPII